MDRPATFVVKGKPATAGSKRAFATKGGKVAVVPDNERQRDWQAYVRDKAIQAWGDRPPVKCGVTVCLEFRFARPKSHYGTGKRASTIKDSAPIKHVTKPDIDKLQRAVLDALTGVLWLDDSQVYQVMANKYYRDDEGATVSVQPYNEKGME